MAAGWNHRPCSGVLGDRVGGGRLVGISALAEPTLSLHEKRELRLNASLSHTDTLWCRGGFHENR
jgi:hypothetical protein